MPSSVHEFDESHTSASRISGGAADAPRLYEEFASNGMPNSVGAPQGNFPFAGLDMGTPQAPFTLHLSAKFVCRRGGLAGQRPTQRLPACDAKRTRRQPVRTSHQLARPSASFNVCLLT